jgi:CHAT domain-containing protein
MIQLWEKQRRPPDRIFWGLGDPAYQPDVVALGKPHKVELAEATRDAERRLRGGARGAAFEPLPGSRDEIVRLGRLLGTGDDDVLLGPFATEAGVKAASRSGRLASYRYVHFACHGVLGLAEGTQPALVLSLTGDQKGEDGFLQLGEVTSLKLNADLVTLSACQTGQGKLYNAEGVAGLARAFLFAGARGVLCSLWRVSDSATSDLMFDFYAGLKSGKPANEALRESKVRMIEAGAPPLHWAPFILIGR